MAVQVDPSSIERGSLRDGRATMFGYFGRSGDTAHSVFDAVRKRLGLNPVQDAPIGSDNGPAAFAFVAADSRVMTSAVAVDGSFLVVNGTIYDDVSVAEVLQSWLTSGVAAFEDLNFDGFVAAWNAKTSEFELIRDRFGAETGYYTAIDGGFLFANDQQALLRLGADSTVHAEAIDTFLTANYFPAPLTPYRAISKIAPGNFVSFGDGEPITAYWARYLPVDPVEYEDARRQIGPIFLASLERMWPGDENVGMLLSGGIDSAMVAVGISRMLGRPVKAFTFRYEEYEGRLNEGEAAQIVAKHLGIPHEQIMVQPHEMLDDLDSAVAMYGEPFNWGLHTYKLGPIADQGIRTVFSGAGADGTDVAKRHAAAYRFSVLPGALQSVMRTVVRGARPLGLSRQEKAEWATRRVKGMGDLFSEDSELRCQRRAALYIDPKLAESGSQLLSSIYNDAASQLPTQDKLSLVVMDKRFTFAETGGAWNRAFTRGNGLEARSPFVDSAYMDLGMGAIGTNGKELMRQLAMDTLPEEAATAPKQPQEMPVSHWIRDSLADPVRERLSDLPSSMTEIFDPAGVRSAVDRHVAGSEDNGWLIIALLTLESWFRQQEA